ncbi:MAG: hypothetical protein II385_02480 [Bacteroidaceae bacterium]|nr:hypothetical protein [Bacteroidaceae bacterium]
MKEAEMRVAAEMQLGRFALKTHGLRMTEMRLRVLGFLEQADKFALLGMLDDMMDDLGRNGVRALGQNVQGLSKRQAMLLLTDLRRWWVVNWCCDAVENCDRIRDLQRRLASVEAENAAMKARLNDGWTGRVTYESMVEQIAAFEDASERDEARKLIEPMLKRETARKFREDIKQKVKELNGEEGVHIQIGQAEVKVQSPGNTIAHTIYNNKE